MAQHVATLSNRFDIEATLGEGGMGVVYRARDRAMGRPVALKRLVVRAESQRPMMTALFEREFHTLAQLSHPSVIEVFDYGVDEQGPFYTMELLEGADLRRAESISHDELCRILHDVASSLSLLHARRLVHRDVTSGNIRVTGTGRAKLIDFGALSPMGPCLELVGTPTYVAPEVLLTQPLDGRVDLYSLGVVLYRALTARYPYRARTMRELRAAWRIPPAPAAQVAEGVPRELSELAMSLIALDRDWRPRDAAEVMERLRAIGSFDRADAPETPRAYLVTPALVGRGEPLRRAREVLVATLRGSGGAMTASGPPGVGHSRMLDAVALEAKVLGAVVLRVGAPHGQHGDFGAAESLVEQLAATELGDVERETLRSSDAPRRHRGDETRLQSIDRIRRFILNASKSFPIVIVADDLHLLDEPSVAVMASLARDAKKTHLALLGAVPEGALVEPTLPLRLFDERSDRISVAPLGGQAIESLIRSIFGNVPHVDRLAAQIHRISRGHPRDAIALAEHLVERGVVTYRAGAFSLPEMIAADELPGNLSAALEARARRLSPLARTVAEAHALSGWPSLSLDECRRLCPGAGPGEVFGALDELVASDVLRVEGVDYFLCHEGWRSVLLGLTDGRERAARHLALARVLEAEGTDPLARAHHLMQAEPAAGAELVARYATEFAGEGVEVFNKTRLSATELGRVFASAFDTLGEAGKTDRRTLGRLRYFMMTLGVFVDARWFFEATDVVEMSLKRDAGYFFWEAFEGEMEPMPRLFAAMQKAQAAYDAAPDEHQYPPPEGIRHLAQYVVAAIAVGARTADGELRRRLPAMLVPFAPLSPVIEAMKENSRSAAESTYADYENASDRLEPVVAALSAPDASSIQHADEIRAACVYAIGAYRARLGIQAAADWIDQVADHPRHASNVMRTRALLALHRGDWVAAEAHQRDAEQYDMEHDSPQLFGRVGVVGEIEVYARALDLTAVKQRIVVIEPFAEKYPGWRPHLDHARAEYERLRGDYSAALEAFDRAVAGALPRRDGEHPDAAWYSAEAGALEMLIELDRLDECRARAGRSLAFGDGKAGGARYDGVQRALALCEARLGDTDAARARLDRLVEHRQSIGSSGLGLGLLYEARTLVELWQEDMDAAETFLALAREQFLCSDGSGFARRFDHLRRQVASGGRAGESVSPRGAEPPRTEAERIVSESLGSCPDAPARAMEGLTLLCHAASADRGYLYLLDPTGLNLSTRTPDEPPPAGLGDYVERRLELEFGSPGTAEPTTMVTVTLGLDVDELLAPFEPDEAGTARAYHPVWIRASLGGQSALVGVAALGVDSAAPLPPKVQAVASAFGDFLARSGDTTVTEAPAGASTAG